MYFFFKKKKTYKISILEQHDEAMDKSFECMLTKLMAEKIWLAIQLSVQKLKKTS